jgi:uncharacterized protein (TIGR03067 family)
MKFFHSETHFGVRCSMFSHSHERLSRSLVQSANKKDSMKITSNLLLASLMAIVFAAVGCSKKDQPESAGKSTGWAAKSDMAITAKSDLATIQKSWHGQEGAGAAAGTNSLVLSGNSLEFHGANPQEWYKGTFTLHEDTTPKQMIVLITDCAAPQYVGKTANAIYKIENGTLTIAGNEPGNPTMPAAFDAPGCRLITFNAQ